MLYLQLSSFYNHIGQTSQLHRKLSPFESHCNQDTYPSRRRSSIYGLLRNEATSFACHAFQGKWELDLGRSISPEEWEKMHSLTHKSSISGYTQEKTIRFSLDGTELLTNFVKFTPQHLILAGDVMWLWVRTYIYGGSVQTFCLFGGKSSHFLTLPCRPKLILQKWGSSP